MQQPPLPPMAAIRRGSGRFEFGRAAAAFLTRAATGASVLFITASRRGCAAAAAAAATVTTATAIATAAAATATAAAIGARRRTRRTRMRRLPRRRRR